jgi:hypothetical protein
MGKNGRSSSLCCGHPFFDIQQHCNLDEASHAEEGGAERERVLVGQGRTLWTRNVCTHTNVASPTQVLFSQPLKRTSPKPNVAFSLVYEGASKKASGAAEDPDAHDSTVTPTMQIKIAAPATSTKSSAEKQTSTSARSSLTVQSPKVTT